MILRIRKPIIGYIFRIKVFVGNQQGGLAILTALGFLLFSVPLITACSISTGDYYSDFTVEFGEGSFGEGRYTWPTVLVSVKDVFFVTANSSDDGKAVISIQVLVGSQNGLVSTWTLQ